MKTMSVTLPESLTAFIESRVAKGDYASPSDYLAALVRDAEIRQAQEELELKLVEGLVGQGRELTDNDWDDIHAEITRRFGKAIGA